jgi:copper transport protein
VTRALAIALAALALLPATAAAHATLEQTTPERGARLRAAPELVTLHFSEPVEAAFGAVRVFDSRGREVQSGRAFHPSGRGSDVAVALRRGLGEDGYTVTYRVISADSHPVSGGFVFVVGDAAAPATTVDELLGDSGAGPVTGTAFGAVRAIQFAAIALALGVLIFLLLCWPPGVEDRAFRARLRTLRRAAVAAGALSAAAGIVLQGAVAGGTTAWAALDPGVIGDVLGTRFGLVWGLAFAAWLLALTPAAVVTIPTLALLPALGGHAGVQEPVALLLPANVLHVVAMSAWLGGIAVLVLALRSATSQLEPRERTRLLAAVLTRFSTLAGIAIAVLIATGVAQGIVEVRSFAHLLDSAFGRAVLIKIVLVAGIVALGWLNRRRLLPALQGAVSPGRAGVLLRRTLRIELALGAAALAATGALAGYPPSVAATQGPFTATRTLGPARAQLTIDPARVGPNEMHLFLTDRRDGSQYDATKELTITAALPDKDIAPIGLEPTRAGPGHHVVSGAALSVAGDWLVQVAIRVNEFDQFRMRLDVSIR